MHRINVALIVGTAAVVLGMSGTTATQSVSLAGGRVSHIGVVTPNIDATVQQYSRVLGIAVPEVRNVSVPVPDGRKTDFKLAAARFPNFLIEIVQPIDSRGPYREHLQTHGMSIQHMAIAVPGDGSIEAERNAVAQHGGRWVLGEKQGNFAYLNFQSTLGIAFEVIHSTSKPGPAPQMPAGGALPPLGAFPVTHVGFAATNTEAVAGLLAKLLGIAAPKVMEYKDAQYPPSSKWNRSAFLRLTMFNQNGAGIEVIESVGGPTPWSEHVKEHKGTAAHHLAINVGDRIDDMIRDLTAKGGTWTNGRPGGSYAYLDFSDMLGFVVELNGTSKLSARK